MAPYVIAAIFFVALDRFLKILSISYFQEKDINLLGDILKFSFAKNYYIAFSIPISGFILVVLIAILILSIFYFLIKMLKNKEYDLAGLLTVIEFGAISNYYDRLRFGFVIDYFDLKWFTVFNLADTMIVVACLFIVFITFRKNQIKK